MGIRAMIGDTILAREMEFNLVKKVMHPTTVEELEEDFEVGCDCVCCLRCLCWAN